MSPMSLPSFNADGDLPPGVHRASLDEVILRFGAGTAERIQRARTLQDIVDLARATGHLDRIIIFGSFVTVKPNPNDVDVILIMQDSFDSDHCLPAARPLFNHVTADSEFGASVFWVRPGLLIHDSLDQFI